MTDLDVLAFARDYGQGTGDEDAIRRAFGSPTRYYQRLSRVLDDAAVLAAEPQLVYRLRRIRDHRSAARVGRRLATRAPRAPHARQN